MNSSLSHIRIYRHSKSPVGLTRQKGIGLVVTIIILIVMTGVAITVTNTNQTQSIMVRNNQFRLEAFNASYAEVDAQIDFVNERKISDGVPPYIVTLIDGEVGDQVSSDAADVTRRIDLLSGDSSDDNSGDSVSTPEVGDPSGDDFPDEEEDTGNSDESVESGYMSRGVAQTFNGTCLLFGQQLGAGQQNIACNELQISADSRLNNTSVVSTQQQVYEYRTLQ